MNRDWIIAIIGAIVAFAGIWVLAALFPGKAKAEVVGCWIIEGTGTLCIPGTPELFTQYAHFIGQEHAWLEQRRSKSGESCCGPTDCQQVPPDEVFSHRDGVQLSERFGGFVVPGREIQISEDGRYWACLAPMLGGGKRMRCFFAPLHGS